MSYEVDLEDDNWDGCMVEEYFASPAFLEWKAENDAKVVAMREDLMTAESTN